MADELQAAQDALAKVTQDVTNIQTAAQAAKDLNTQLQQQVADLQAQIGAGTVTGIDPAAVQAIADGLNAIDAQLDAVAPDPQP